jgi:hypothetical protein
VGFSDSELTVTVEPSVASELKDLQLVPISEAIGEQKSRNRLAFSLAGGGVPLIATGTIFAKIQVNRASEENTTNKISEFDRVFTISTLGAGIALVTTGTVLYLLNRSYIKTQQENKPSISIVPAYKSLSAMIQFPLTGSNQFRGIP